MIKDKYKQLEPTNEENKNLKINIKTFEKSNLNKKYEKEKINLKKGAVIVKQTYWRKK